MKESLCCFPGFQELIILEGELQKAAEKPAIRQKVQIGGTCITHQIIKCGEVSQKAAVFLPFPLSFHPSEQLLRSFPPSSPLHWVPLYPPTFTIILVKNVKDPCANMSLSLPHTATAAVLSGGKAFYVLKTRLALCAWQVGVNPAQGNAALLSSHSHAY